MPQISMPNSSPGAGAPKKNFMDHDPFTGEDFSSKSSKVEDSTDGSKKDRKISDGSNSGGKQTASGGGGSGWFGGIWNRLSMKPKNQMILPDDKNPAVRRMKI